MQKVIQYKHDSGRPEALECLLLYFLLRHNKLLSVHNIKLVCEAICEDPRCGWKLATSNLGPVTKVLKLPKVSSYQLSETEMKEVEEKFGGVCKSLVDRMVDDSCGTNQ